jgi:tetratricopeptide (TPR) repeat protein
MERSRQGCIQEALASFDKGIQLNSEDFDSWYYRGYILDEQKRYEEALLAYDRSLKVTTADIASMPWHNKGITLNNLKRYEQAIAAFDRAIKNNDYFSEFVDLTIADSWYGRGVALYSLKRYQEAVSSFDRAISERSDFADAIKARSIAKRQLR